MVGAESKNTTYASAEQMFLAHVVHCLAPWYQRIEQSIDANLLTEADRAAGLYSCFVDAGLLRGSITNQKDVIIGYVNGGIMTPNEGRALLDMNPDADPKSNELRIPANIAGAQPEPAAAADPAAADTAKAIDELRAELKDRPINVDARTTIAEGAVSVPVQLGKFGVQQAEFTKALAGVTNAIDSVAAIASETVKAGEAMRQRQDDLESGFADLSDAVLAPRVNTFVKDDKGTNVAVRSVVEKPKKARK
jgi:hypothetical protein